MRKGTKHSPDSLMRISESKKKFYSTNQHHRKGAKFTPEQLSRLSESHKGIVPTEKQIEALNLGREIHRKMVFVPGKSDNPKYRKWQKHLNSYRRREAKRIFGNAHTESEWVALKEKYKLTCPSCGKAEPEIKLTRDHIIPLSKGGSDSIENIQPLCKSCNCKKHLKIIKF